MNNNDVGAYAAGIIFLSMYSMICLGLSGMILCALKQFAQINLFIDYNGFPISVFILALIIIVSSISVILKTNKGKK